MKNIAFLLLMVSLQANCKFTLSPLFSDDMVLQRDVPAKIWGRATPNEGISIIFKSKKYTAIALADSTWKINIGTHSAGGPFDMLIQSVDNSQLYFENIKFGDVWLCSGQSNMEFSIDALSTPDSIIKTLKNENVSMLTLDKISSNITKKDVLSKDGWLEATPATVGRFSATAFYFGNTLNKAIDVPIGLVSNNWGGSPAEVWMSEKSLATFPEIAKGYNLKNAEDSIIIKAMNKRKLMLNTWIAQAIAKDSISTLYASRYDQIVYQNWTKSTIPLDFEKENMTDFNGILWVIMEFEISEKLLNKPLTLVLGNIDDADNTYINGIKVGENSLYSAKRNYKIEANVFKNGKNVLAIRMINNGGVGTIIPQGKSFYVSDEANNMQFLGNDIYICKGYDLSKIAEYTKPDWRYEAGWQPSTLYKGMVAPMLEIPIKGVIWYQGESNSGRAYQYRTLFPALILDWRKSFNQPNLPFLFVQLANFMQPDSLPKNDPWPELREAQTFALKLPFTAMSTAIDVGDANDIHPKDKKTVGTRLAAQAQKLVYGKKIIADGPNFVGMKIIGNKITLSFNNIGSGIITKSGTPQEFAVAGANKKYYKADAKIVNNTIVLTCAKVAKPVAVRYAWANNPSKVNTYNKEGFPLNPFRTDQWKGVTFGKWKIE